MKRKLLIFISIFILFTGGCSNQKIIGDDGLYAFSEDTSEFDEFAKDDLFYHLYAFHGYVSDSMKLGKGIKVYGKKIPGVLYPVWKNDKVVGVYNVIIYEGEFSGSYHNGNIDQLNYAIGKTNMENPLKLLKTDTGFYYKIGNTIYDMTDGKGKIINDLRVKIAYFIEYMFVKGESINVKETLEFSLPY